MATAKKLPSGSWRVRVFEGYEEKLQPDGTLKRTKKYHSITVDDPSKKGKRKCEVLAAEWAMMKDEEKERAKDRSELTFAECMDKYIEKREVALSPRTIAEYKRVRRSCLQSLMPLRIEDITTDDIQRTINDMALRLAPKTVKNRAGLITAVMKEYRPEFAVRTTLPRPKRYDRHIPTEDDIARILEGAKGTPIELPIMLAAFGSLRRSEISAIDMADINGNTIHVKQAMVQNENKEWVVKVPKTFAGDRFVTYPDFVAEMWKGKTSGRLVELDPRSITKRFIRLLERLDMPKFRFHDLRHFFVSYGHSVGIPDSYLQKTGGWSTDVVMKNIYRHTMSDMEKQMSERLNSHFESMVNHGR